MKKINTNPLMAADFAPYGDVIEMAGHQPQDMNYGMADRYQALAKVDANDDQGYPVISLVHARQYELPQSIQIIERHPLGSQAFIPLDNTPFIVIVGRAGDGIQAQDMCAFITNGQQGINYHKGVWHGLLFTPFAEMDFICVDRAGGGNNCEEIRFEEKNQYVLEVQKP